MNDHDRALAVLERDGHVKGALHAYETVVVSVESPPTVWYGVAGDTHVMPVAPTTYTQNVRKGGHCAMGLYQQALEELELECAGRARPWVFTPSSAGPSPDERARLTRAYEELLAVIYPDHRDREDRIAAVIAAPEFVKFFDYGPGVTYKYDAAQRRHAAVSQLLAQWNDRDVRTADDVHHALKGASELHDLTLERGAPPADAACLARVVREFKKVTLT